MERMPLDLFAEVETPNGGRYRWDANQAPGSRLRNFSFRTKLGEGFSDASGQLARRIDLDYPDLGLINNIVVVGADGSVAYEGRLQAMPRELTDAHSIGVTLAGWMAHAKDKKFTAIYVDRDIAAWQPMSRARRQALITSNVTPFDPSQLADQTDARAGLSTGWTGGWASPFTPQAEAWYDAGPLNTISRCVYSWRRETTPTGGVDNTNANWSWAVFSSTDDKATSTGNGGEQRAAGPVDLASFTVAGMRYLFLRFLFGATPAGSDGQLFSIGWYKLAVYGNNGVSTYTGEPTEPPGVRASDVMKHIAASFCPELNTSGIQTSTYVIQHLAFKDRTYPYDAFLELNKFQLWHLGVWENKTLTFRPYDFSDYEWEIRTDDPGTTFSPTGPSTENLFNGIVVTYDDILSGVRNVLTPTSNPELKDTSSTNPWNQNGIDAWDEIQLSTPTLGAEALQVGRAALAERNRPKTPGTITVRGYVRNRAGIYQPGWKCRAGDMISVTNFPNDTPRLITETSWDDESKTITLTIDSPAPILDAYLDRVSNALQARGLSNG